MSVNLTGIVGDITNLIPSNTDLVQNVVLGAATSVVLAGLKSNAGMDAIDPLHIIHKDPVSGAPASSVVGKSITSGAFNALSPGAQSQVLAAGYVIAG